jgi:hypothetical protein
LFSVIFVASFARSYGIGAAELRDAILPAALLATALAAPFVPLVLATYQFGDTRLRAAALLAALVACYGAIYWPLASWLGLLPRRLVPKRLVHRPAAS